MVRTYSKDTGEEIFTQNFA